MQRFFYRKSATPTPIKRAPKPFDRILQQRGEMPADQLCPITLEHVANYPVQDCVIFIDGHVYQRAALLTWLNQHATAPTTNQDLSAFVTRYGITTSSLREIRLARLEHRLFSWHVAVYVTLALIGLSVFLITTKEPLPNSTAQHAVSSISLSMMFFAMAYLMVYTTLTCCRRSSESAETIRPPLLQNDASAELFDQVQRHYHAFMLPYDPNYFVRAPATTLGFPG